MSESGAIVIEDRLEGSRGVKDAHGWRELTRIIIVNGLTLDASWAAKADEAHIASGVGDIGEFSSYPDDADSFSTMILDQIEFNVVDGTPTSIEMVCTYKRAGERSSHFEDNAISLTSSTSSVEITKDRNGEVAYLEYYWRATEPGNPFTDPQTGKGKDWVDRVPAIRQCLKPEFTWSVDRIAKGRTRKEMKALVKKYMGSVNKEKWDDNDPRTVLCTNIAVNSRDGGKTWECTFSYQWKENTWDITTAYVKPSTGKIIDDLDYWNNYYDGYDAQITTGDYPEEDWDVMPTGDRIVGGDWFDNG